MTPKQFVGALLALAVSSTLLSSAFAQPAVPEGTDDKRLHAAWEDLLETEGSLLGGRQAHDLTNLAYPSAIVRVCDSFAFDREALGKALDEILAAGDKTSTAVQNEERSAAILIAFGARYGLFIAEGHSDRKVFCEAGAKLKASPERNRGCSSDGSKSRFVPRSACLRDRIQHGGAATAGPLKQACFFQCPVPDGVSTFASGASEATNPLLLTLTGDSEPHASVKSCGWAARETASAA